MTEQDMKRLMAILGKCEIPMNRRLNPRNINVHNVRWLIRNIRIQNPFVEDLDWAMRKLVYLSGGGV